uniref:Beta-arrestin2 n=1 Tax=Hirondellea gigas TaxID=1518452 RepID=A0A2P2ICZ4_9CRUS
MGITNLLVVLEPYLPVYFSGQQVSGHVYINVSSVTPLKELVVSVKGNSLVNWNERHGKSTYVYRAEEIYFNTSTIVWNGADYDSKMQGGDFKFPFSIVLPGNIPSSFEGTHGNVRYRIKAKAVRSMKFDVKHTTYFSVNTLLDLNCCPAAKDPVVLREEATSCVPCLSAGPVIVSLALSKAGYVPGETLLLNGEIRNNSNSDIISSNVDIVQTISYITKEKIRDEKRVVQNIAGPYLAAGGSYSWNNAAMTVPAVVPSQLIHCNIINVSYSLMFSSKQVCCKQVKVHQPIIIGSIPLAGGLTTTLRPSAPVLASPGTVPQFTIVGATAPEILPEEYDLPPSYNEAVGDGTYRPHHSPCMFSSTGQAGDVPEGWTPTYLTYHGHV